MRYTGDTTEQLRKIHSYQKKLFQTPSVRALGEAEAWHIKYAGISKDSSAEEIQEAYLSLQNLRDGNSAP